MGAITEAQGRRHLESVLVALIDPNPDNARKSCNPAELAGLAASLRQRQISPCIVFRNGSRFVLADGWRRWQAAALAPLERLDCIVLDHPPCKGELLLTQLAIDIHSEDLNPMELAHLFANAMDANGLSAAQLHEKEGVSPATITRHLTLLKGSPPVQQAIRDRLIGVSDGYQISKQPMEEQAELLRLKLGGASRDELAGHVRRKRNGAGPVATASRVGFPLASGVSLSLRREEKLSLDDVIEALAEAQKEARKAREQGLDAKTFQAVMRQKGKNEA